MSNTTLPLDHSTTSPLPRVPDKEDRERLNLLFRTRGDAVSFMGLRVEEPLDLIAWLNQPHIKPWHDAILALFRENREADTQKALSRSLNDITRILDVEANATLKIRAINSIIKLANAIFRSHSLPPGGRAGVGLAKLANPTSRPAPNLAYLDRDANLDSLAVEESAQRIINFRAELNLARGKTDRLSPIPRSHIRRLEENRHPPLPEGNRWVRNTDLSTPAPTAKAADTGAKRAGRPAPPCSRANGLNHTAPAPGS